MFSEMQKQFFFLEFKLIFFLHFRRRINIYQFYGENILLRLIFLSTRCSVECVLVSALNIYSEAFDDCAQKFVGS